MLATLHRKQSQLSSALNKIFKIDDHMGIAVSGVAADGRVMTRFMRNECLNHRRASAASASLRPAALVPPLSSAQLMPVVLFYMSSARYEQLDRSR